MKKVENFEVENEHARILFKEPVNLYGVKVEEEIILKEKMVEVHPKGDIEKGTGFNKKAVVEFKNIFDEKARILPRKMLDVKAMRFVSSYPNLEFVCYDYDENKLVFKAEHF